MTTIDFNKALADAKSASFEALPKGDYNIEVASAEAVTASTGRPMIKCKMKVIDGPYQNRPVMTQFVLVIDNPNALSMFFRNMKAFGLDEAFFAQMGQMGSLEPVAGALSGRRAQVTLGTRLWNGEDRNEVTNIKKYTGAPGTATGPSAPGMPGMPPMGGPGPIANIPSQVMQQAPQAPQVPAVPAVQAPPQAPVQPQAPVAPPAAPQAVQAPVAPTSVAQHAAQSAQEIRQADPGSTAADVAQLVAAQTANAPAPTPEETQAATPPQVPTAAETAPPTYAQPEQPQQYVDSNAQAMPTPPAPPI